MATDRCPACDKGLRDGECRNPDCGWVASDTTAAAPRPPVHRPGPPRTASPTQSQHRTPEPWRPPTAAEAEIARLGVAAGREILAAHQPHPESPTRAHLRAVAGGLGRPKAVEVASEVLDELPDPEETRP